MKKVFLTTAMLLALMSLQAQVVEMSDERWLQRNPASPDRAERLLEVERQQILETGTYNVSPFLEPTLTQIAPSLQHLQYFFEGQRDLYNMHHQGGTDYTALRKRYEQLYAMADPSYMSEAEYYLGYIDYAEGKYDSALKHFANLPAEQKYRYSVDFYEMQIHFAQGKYSEALAACKRMEGHAYITREQNVEITRIKAECQMQNGDNAAAIDQFRTYLQSTEQPIASSAYNAAVLEYKEQNFSTAVQNASLATTTSNEQLRQLAYMLIGQADLQLSENQQARLAFEQAAKGPVASVAEPAAYNVCAITHAGNFSLWDDEVTLLEDFLNTYPTSVYADRVSTFLSEVYTTTRNYEAALASINKVRQPNSALLQAKQRLLHQLGIQNYVNGKYEEAVQRFNECVNMGAVNVPTQAEAYFWRGESRYHLADYKGAVADYQQFITINPRTVAADMMASAYYSQGYAYMKQQQYADAISAFNSFSTQPKGDAETYNDGLVRLADCYYYTRQFSAAEDTYRTVSQNFGNQADYALYQEALMLGLQKKYGQEQETLENLISRYPQSDFVDDAWMDKGRTALLQGNNSEAIRSFQQVIDNYADSPVAPQAAVQLAMTYNNMGQTEAAQRIYQLVAERYPNTDAATTAAEDLKTLSIQQRVASLPGLYKEGKYEELIDTYQQLQQQNVDFRDRQAMQLLAAKSHLALKQNNPGTSLLIEAAQDLRTASGAEAKFLLAQNSFDAGELTAAQNGVNELIQSGTPHQYWLARGIILLSDIYNKQGETFTATEYLKSLKQNYTADDDIQTLIDARLPKETSRNDNENDNENKSEN